MDIMGGIVAILVRNPTIMRSEHISSMHIIMVRVVTGDMPSMAGKDEESSL